MSRGSALALPLAGLLLAACGDRPAPAGGEPPAPPPRGAAPAPPAPGPPAERAERPGRRGDRHARAAARERRPVREVAGTVVRSEDGRLTIRPRGGPEVTLRIGPRTAVAGPGQPGRAALAPGDEVRASYRSGAGDPPTAISVEVRGAPEGARPDPFTDRG